MLCVKCAGGKKNGYVVSNAPVVPVSPSIYSRLPQNQTQRSSFSTEHPIPIKLLRDSEMEIYITTLCRLRGSRNTGKRNSSTKQAHEGCRDKYCHIPHGRPVSVFSWSVSYSGGIAHCHEIAWTQEKSQLTGSPSAKGLLMSSKVCR